MRNSVLVNAGKCLFAITTLTHFRAEAQKKEDSVINVVWAIKEVKQLMHQHSAWRKAHPGTIYPRTSIIIKARPTPRVPYYWVSAGANDSFSWVPVYNFYVRPDNYTVMVYDVITDSVLTLREWRRRYHNAK